MKKKLITISLMTLGVVFIVAGVALKQPAGVLAKAVRICMECIGLG